MYMTSTNKLGCNNLVEHQELKLFYTEISIFAELENLRNVGEM